MRPERLGRGYVQVYTGDGKGKTTAALGLALRAAGHGLKVAIYQFMKGGGEPGEVEGIRMLSPYVEIFRSGRDSFVDRKRPDPEDSRLASLQWERAKEAIAGRKADIVILDEINCAMDFGLLPVAEVLDAVRNKPADLELVLTGRGAPGEIVKAADLVTEMLPIKHYNAQGVGARAGIER
ncbi:MAG: cob(I)yrinic acid a,c-diamide adenosyltransferase [Thermodesulfobacteriota bacterium]